MRRATRNGVIAVVAASGAMAAAGTAHADSTADATAAGSPGVLAGNGLQLPVHVPANVCGNTVNVVGLLNPAVGNFCAAAPGPSGADRAASGAGRSTAAGPDRAVGASSTSGRRSLTGADRPAGVPGPRAASAAAGAAEGSPGLLSGNGLGLPVDLPVNLSGNSVNAVGVGNPSFGNESVNASADGPEESPASPQQPGPDEPQHPDRPDPRPQSPLSPPEAPPAPPAVVDAPSERSVLARTGTDAALPAAAGAAALFLGGVALHRGTRRRRSAD